MSRKLHLFEGYGVEIEYMIVDRATWAVRPLADRVLVEDGAPCLELESGDLCWSNELALHVVELKTNGPVDQLDGVASSFLRDVRRIDAQLAGDGATLLPGGVHPFMDPATDTHLWPHEQNDIYRAFDAIFGCKGHGWSNLQSVHLNLPFQGDDELGKLHAAIRLVLPVIPALSASSPFLDGRRARDLDARLEVYRTNAAKVPSVTGAVVPEAVFTKADYESQVLAPMYADIAQFPQGEILTNEWLNARGAIVRFDRDAIEIRVIDTQETPAADIAVLRGVVAAVRALVEGRTIGYEAQTRARTQDLAAVFRAVVREGERALVADPAVLAAFGATSARTAGELWRGLLDAHPPEGGVDDFLATVLDQGPLARRMLAHVPEADHPGATPDRSTLTALCERLSTCLVGGHSLSP